MAVQGGAFTDEVNTNQAALDAANPAPEAPIPAQMTTTNAATFNPSPVVAQVTQSQPVQTGGKPVTGFFSTLREWSHAAIAIIGVLTAGVAGVVTTINSFGVHITDLQAVQGLGVAGGIATLISKLVDSANNAVTTPSSTP